MKFFKKMNRGFLLLLICLLAVAIYLIASGFIQSKDKKEIVALCEEYIQVELSYSMLPEEYREDPSGMSTEEVDVFLDSMKTDITSYYVDNEATYTNILSTLSLNMLGLLQGQSVVTQYEKIVQKFTDITFDDDKVTLTAQCLTTYNGEQNMTKDAFALQKVDGKWKLTYSSLITVPADLTNSYY